MTEANAINAATTGIVGNTGTGFTGTAVTQYNVITGAATSSTLNNVAPSATSGVPLISQGSSAQPIFGTAAIAGGGTNATSMSTSTGIVKYDGTSLVTSTTAKIDSSNRYTNTSQPAFFAYLAISDTNATGAGTTYTLGGTTALTKSLDQGSNFNTNGTFTAPVTGVYLFTGSIMLGNITVGNSVNLNLVASGITYRLATYNASNGKNVGSGNVQFMGSVVISMTASDTAQMQINSTGEAGNTETVVGSSTRVSFFSGFLVC